MFCSGNITLVSFILKFFCKSVIYWYTLNLAVIWFWQCLKLISASFYIGNSYGMSNDGRNCKGCGKQEQFYGCADVAISPADNGSQGNGSPRPNLVQEQIVESRPQLIPTFVNGDGATCRGVQAFRFINSFADSWCQSNCRQGYCPMIYCTPACQKLTVYG